MPTDYRAITDENIKRYGTAIDEYGPLLLSDRYGDRTHFVYELLQNAEDAIGWRLLHGERFPKEVSFELLEDTLLFRHHGLPFAEEHVRGICNIGKGTKARDLTAIGKHGIGFKSVYAYTHHPEVHSADEHFVIDWFVRPRSVPPKPTIDGETLFHFPFDHPDVPAANARTEIAGRLRAIGLKTLLFLRNIESIAWAIASGGTGQYLRDSKALAEGVDRITFLGKEDGKDEAMQEWLVFSRPVQHEGRPAGFVEVAFSLETGNDNGENRVVPVHESPLVVFFPTEKATHFGFLVQGPYRTTPSRDNIPKDDAWNKYLVSQTVNVLTWALACIRDQKLMTVGALEALIVDLEKYEPGSQAGMFRPIAEAIIDSLRTQRLIPGFRGGHLAGSAACIARTEGLRTLISHAQLAEVTGSKAGWVTGEITFNRTPRLRTFLTDSIRVKEFDGEGIIREMSSEFLSSQSDEWMAQFYAFLLDQRALQRQSWFLSKPIVRLKTGEHVPPFGPNDAPNAYLPGPGRTDFPTVKISLCEGDSLKFLQQLGLKPPDPVDDVIRNVLPKYQNDQVEADGAEYDDDIRRIIEAFGTDSKGQKDKLLASLCKSSFIMSVDVGDGEKYVSPPGEVYLATERLKQLFAGVPGIMLVDDDYACLRGEDIRDLLEACGVSRHVRPVAAPNALSRSEKSELRQQSGYSSTSGQNDHVEDWTLDGLDSLLETLPKLPIEECKTKAELLWQELAQLEARSGKGVFTGEYTWTHYGSRRAPPFDAAFVRTLNRTAWIPDADGQLQHPEFILFEPLGWKPSPFLESKIRFKPPIIDALAKEAGIEPGILDLLKKLGLTSVAELSSRLGIDAEDEDRYEDEADSKVIDADDQNVEEEEDKNDELEDETDQGEGDSEEDQDGDNVGDVDDTIKDILGDVPGPTPPVDDPAGPELRGGGGGKGFGRGNGEPGGTRGRHKGDEHSGQGEKGMVRGKQGGGTKPFISYVATHPDDEEPDPDGLDHDARMSLEEQAIKLILAHEPQLRRTPTHNPGFDLFEGNIDGRPLRRVEVKAMTGDLRSRPVTLSHTQFDCARMNGRTYWLYVVEHAGDLQRARIIRIQDPAGKARTFCFDHGWISVAEVERPDTDEGTAAETGGE